MKNWSVALKRAAEPFASLLLHATAASAGVSDAELLRMMTASDVLFARRVASLGQCGSGQSMSCATLQTARYDQLFVFIGAIDGSEATVGHPVVLPSSVFEGPREEFEERVARFDPCAPLPNLRVGLRVLVPARIGQAAADPGFIGPEGGPIPSSPRIEKRISEILRECAASDETVARLEITRKGGPRGFEIILHGHRGKRRVIRADSLGGLVLPEGMSSCLQS